MKQRAAGLEFNTVSPLQDAVCEFSRSSYFLPRVVLSTSMHGDVGLGIDMAPPSRIARMTDVKGPCEPQKRLPKSGIAARGRNTVGEGDAHSQTLVAMRSSKGMTGLLLAEVGGSMVEMNKLGGGMGSNFREGKHIEPGAVTPVGISRIPPPSNSTQSSRAPSRLRTEHRRGMSLDQGLTRHGTLLSAQASPVRRAAELKVLLGDSSAKVKSGAIVSSQQARSKKSPNAVAFEQGRSRVRVALNMDLENNVATEGGYISGTLLFCVRPKKKDDALSLGGGKIRVAGFEVAPGNEDRYIFYQVAAPLAGISNGCDGLYTSAVDDEGFGSVGEGEYRVRFSLKLPLAGTGGKARGILNSRSGATIKYIIIASMKVVDSATGKRSIAHFYRDCEIWPALDPVLTLAPAPDPMLARAAKKVFMGGDGTVAVTASLHRCTWVAGQPVHVRLRIANDTRKTVRNVSLALMRTTTLFRPSARVSSFGDDMDASETATSEKRVAEAVLTAGQKGTKGHASAKGWWTGVGPGENIIIGHSITIPSDALTIPRSRLVEVDYAVRVSLGVSSIAGNSEAVHVTLPIRIVNFISLDPPPSGPVLPMQSSSVIELDTPRPESYSTSDSAVGMRMGESPSRVFLSPQYDSIGRSEMHGSFEREKMNAFSRVSFEMPLPSLPTAHTLHDLGGVEDAEDLNGMLGDIPGSVSILEEADITLDSGYSEGEFSAFSNRSSYIQDDLDPEGHGSAHRFDDSFDEDIGSDEELERVVGCASARIDGGAFQYSRTAYRPASPERKRMPSRGESYSSEERHAVRPGAILYEQPADIPKAHRSGGTHGIRGPRDRTAAYQHHVDVPQRQFVGHYGEEAVGLDVPKAQPYERPGADTLYATRSMLQVSGASSHSLKESPSSMYSSAAHAATTSESLRASPSKHMSSIPSKVSMQRLPRSRPPVSRARTAPANAVQISNTSDRGGVALSSSATRAATDVPAAKLGGVSSVRARIAMLEEKARDEEGSVNVRPDLVSRSLTTSAIPS